MTFRYLGQCDYKHNNVDCTEEMGLDNNLISKSYASALSYIKVTRHSQSSTTTTKTTAETTEHGQPEQHIYFEGFVQVGQEFTLKTSENNEFFDQSFDVNVYGDVPAMADSSEACYSNLL